jgi:hypothetical protein
MVHVIRIYHDAGQQNIKNREDFTAGMNTASFRETCQWLKFPLYGIRAQSGVSPVVGLLTLAIAVNRMPRNRLPRIMKHYSPSGRRNHGRPLKRLLDT